MAEIYTNFDGFNVPLLIVVNAQNVTTLYRHGKKVDNLQAISFSAGIDMLPTIETKVFLRK